MPEQLSLPGAGERVLWAGGDSTLEVIGAADWEAKVYGRVLVADVVPPLQALARETDGTGIIVVAEFRCLAIPAAARGRRGEVAV